VNKQNLKKIYGFSLVELVVALGVFGLVSTVIGVMSLDSLRGMRNDELRVEAHMQLESMMNLILQRKSEVWSDMVLYTADGPKNVDLDNGSVVLSDGSVTTNGITSWFEIDTVNRDGTGAIVNSGGTFDPYTRKVTLYTQWVDIFNNPQEVVEVLFINDWNTARWTVTTEAEYELGTHFQTITAPVGDGAVSMATLLYPDWCNPALTLTAHDIPGNGDARTVTAQGTHAYMGTGGNASGIAFTHVSIAGVETPVLTVEGDYNSGKVNDIEVTDDLAYAVLGTDTSGGEVKMLDLTQASPYPEVGYFDFYKSYNGDAVAIGDGFGLVGGDKYLSSFGLSSFTGARSELDRITLNIGGGDITDIDIVGDYAYISVTKTSAQISIVDISDPNNLVEKGTTYVNSYNVSQLYVRDDGQRIYLGTESAAGDDFYIIDVSDKETPGWSAISSYETSGMSVYGITTVKDGNLVILVGNGGEEYQVVDISDELSPSRCGGLDLPLTMYDVTWAEDVEGNVFSYVVTSDTAEEFKIIRGGPGGGWGSGYGYANSAEYTSSVYDTGTSSTVYYFVSWLETMPVGTDIQIQLRTSNNPDMSGSSWVGPDGSGGTFFTTETGERTPASLNFKRYLQFRAVFSGDTIETPLLEEISVSYQN
jgi:type II secretory pathway pseudopilin PulG